jgi:hypothetical protein
MGRNYLARTDGDFANAVPAAAGYNLRPLLQGRKEYFHKPTVKHNVGATAILSS